MKALSIEQSILEGEFEVQQLFKFVNDHAVESKAYDMEKAIFSRLMKVGQAALKSYFALKGTGDVGPELDINGVKFSRAAGLYGRDYYSVFGKIKVPRTCYRSEGVAGVMPLDARADLPAKCYSYLLQEWMNIMSVRETYRESELTLNRLLGLDVSGSRFEVVNKSSSGDYDRFYEEKALPGDASEGELQVMQFDGKGVPVIKREASKLKGRLGKGEKHQKKKEAMVGVGYTVDRKERTPEEVAENLIYPDKAEQRKAEIKKQGGASKEAPRAKNIRRLASLAKSKQAVVEEMAEDSHKRNVANKRPLVILMDGARGLWELIIKVLAGMDFIGILDIIHVTEYLWKAGNALYGEKTKGGRKWVYRQLLAILQGRVGWVIGGMKQTLTKRKLKAAQRKALNSAVQYFENHRQWMKYDEYLKAGFPIGTGVVESTCGHTVKDRMEGSGLGWSIAGAESVLLLRSVYTSGDWEPYWQEHIRFERERLYGEILKTGNICDDYYKNEEKKAA